MKNVRIELIHAIKIIEDAHAATVNNCNADFTLCDGDVFLELTWEVEEGLYCVAEFARSDNKHVTLFDNGIILKDTSGDEVEIVILHKAQFLTGIHLEPFQQ